MKVTLGHSGTVTKGLVHELEDFEIRERVEAIQIKALLTSAKILWIVLETRWLAVTQTPLRNYQVNQIWKTHKGEK